MNEFRCSHRVCYSIRQISSCNSLHKKLGHLVLLKGYTAVCIVIFVLNQNLHDARGFAKLTLFSKYLRLFFFFAFLYSFVNYCN